MSASAELDLNLMRRALNLAEKGRLTTGSNPRVGCVIARNGHIIGEGYHLQAGSPHAEVHALRAVTAQGQDARGATAYVTLEPCSHHGRTPPCAEALVNAGVARVVVAMTDPNPQVAGRGLKCLRDAGIAVDVGLLQAQAEALNPGFIKRMRTGFPFVRVKLAASLDGRTALANGDSQWITSRAARQDVQRLRAQSNAIITGADSVLADDPSMNVRPHELGDWQALLTPLAEHGLSYQQPLRVVVDGRNRLQPPRQLLACEGEVLLASLGEYSCTWPEQVQHWRSAPNGNHVDLLGLILTLGQRGINEVLVEAGAHLAGAFIQAELWDEIILYQAPKLLGEGGRGLVQWPPLTQLSQALSLQYSDIRQIGPDLRLTLTRRER